MKIQDALVAYLEAYGHIDGTQQHVNPTSEQGQNLMRIRGKETVNSSVTAALSVLRRRKIVDTIRPKYWVLTVDYQKHLEAYRHQEVKKLDKGLAKMIRFVVGDQEEANRHLDEIGDIAVPYGSKTDKRDAGCRQRVEEGYDEGRAMFTGEKEWGGRQASHSIECRAMSKLVDNSFYNLLLLRNDIHWMRDTPNEDGVYLAEIHCHPDGLVLKIRSNDPQYAKYDGKVEQLPMFSMREIQKRVIIGNMVRGISQEVPAWFEKWLLDEKITKKPKPKKEEPECVFKY